MSVAASDTTSVDPLWYKDAVIYQLHVKTFHDSNGDGIGDFRGLIEKLDYLQELGVTAIWILPFYPSPLKDDGYDTADYTNINPEYGTMESFQEFLRAAHARGLDDRRAQDRSASFQPGNRQLHAAARGRAARA